MENGCNSKFPLFYWQEGKVETVFKIIWFAPCTLMHKVSFPDITEYVMMSLLWQLMKQVPEYSCFENFWVLIYNTVNIKNITHILKALVIFESLKESWDEQICETLLSRHERHAEFRLTLCNPMDCSLSGSSVHGILQARILRVGCNFLLQGIFPDPEIEPEFPALVGRLFIAQLSRIWRLAPIVSCLFVD